MDAPNGASRMDHERERALVERARSDAAAVGQLYDFYLPRVYGFAIRRVQEPSVAEDVTATTFQRALEAMRNRLFPNDAFGPWLFRVAASAVVDHVHDGQRLVSLAMTDGPVGDAFAASLDRDELRTAMALLSGQQREVLILRFCDDLNADEASAVIGCSRDTFAVRLQGAIGALRAATDKDATDAA
jgi:RNA polymerase sigma-70 factor (ECF subfamily)